MATTLSWDSSRLPELLDGPKAHSNLASRDLNVLDAMYREFERVAVAGTLSRPAPGAT